MLRVGGLLLARAVKALALVYPHVAAYADAKAQQQERATATHHYNHNDKFLLRKTQVEAIPMIFL
jgi:hypothetical protein